MKKENYKLLAEEVLEKASLKGANFSDVVIIGNISKNIGCRLGKVEEIEQSETQILGLRTFIGKKNAITSTNNFNKESINETIDRVIEMTKLTPDDPLPGLANETTKKIPELDLYDDTDLGADKLKELDSFSINEIYDSQNKKEITINPIFFQINYNQKNLMLKMLQF